MKTTAFTQKHIALGAKMVPFAGYNMPVEYVGINEEHKTVREGVGVFDVSHMGEFWVKGPNALAFVQYVSSNDASVLYPGKIQYDCFPNGPARSSTMPPTRSASWQSRAPRQCRPCRNSVTRI